MTPPPPGRPLPAWHPFATAVLPALLLGLAAAVPVRAQNVGTVRDNEFRSRWANYQVDRSPKTDNTTSGGTNTDTANTASSPAVQPGLLASFGRSFDDLLRNGPLQLRANLGAGWEFSDEDNLRTINPNGTDNSFFAAPAFGLFYNQELGPVTVSARYSLGYVYYLDQNYLAANHNGGIMSQTAGLDISLDGKRTSLVSTSGFSYGDGNDIESGQMRTLLDLNESLTGTYQLTEFTQIGASAGVSFQRYSGGTVPETNSLSDQGSVYGDYVITGKTRLRLEFDAGQQLQDSSNTNHHQRPLFLSGRRVGQLRARAQAHVRRGPGLWLPIQLGRGRARSNRLASRLSPHDPLRADRQDLGELSFRLRGR